MLNRQNVFCLAIAFMLALSTASIALETDFSVVITDSEDPVRPDSTVRFEFEVTNAGPDTSSNSIILDITLPMDVPVPFMEYLAADDNERGAIIDAFWDAANLVIDDNIWDDSISSTYTGDSFNNGCAGLMFQPQDLMLPAGTSGSLFFDVNLPSSGGTAGVAYTNADGEKVVLNYGVGGCNSSLFDDCGNGDPAQGIPCMGPPLTMHPATGAPISLVEDGTDPVGDGCQSLVGFPAGHIALIDRGDCTFVAKADHAIEAGASGVIIANYSQPTDPTPTHDSVMLMGCIEHQCHSLIITIPTAFISFNDGVGLKAAMTDGDVTGLMGLRDEDPEYRRMTAYIWESSMDPYDPDPDNDRFIETTRVDTLIFVDAFESGDTSAWVSLTSEG